MNEVDDFGPGSRMMSNLVKTNENEEPKHRMEGGSTRSEKAPPFHLVPPFGGRRTARRFGLGADRHGEGNWMKSINESREAAYAFCKEAYNHMMEHARKMAADLDPEGVGADPADDHLGAIGWAIEVLAYAEEKYGCRWTQLGRCTFVLVLAAALFGVSMPASAQRVGSVHILASPLPPSPLPPAVSAGFIPEDRTTGGDWRAYGAVGRFLYPDGATGWFVANPDKAYFKGVGTLTASGQFQSFGGLCTFDPRATLRQPGTNGFFDMMCGAQLVRVGDPWPPNARFAGGLYNRTICDPCPPPFSGAHSIMITPGALRFGLRLDVPYTVRFYLNDMNRADNWSARAIKVDVYEETDRTYVDAPAIGSPSYEPGALLLSKVVRDFDTTGVYVGMTASGPIVVELSGVEPHLHVDGSPVTDPNGIVVLQGVFLDVFK